MSDLRPHNNDAEEAVLGSLLLASEQLPDVAARLKPSDFLVERHAWIYQAMLDAGSTDFISVMHQLDARGHLDEAGGQVYLATLTNGAPFNVFATGAVDIVQEMATRRALLRAFEEGARLAHSDSTPIDEVCRRSVDGVQRAADHRAAGLSQVADGGEVAADVYLQARIRRENPTDHIGHACGIRPLDGLTLGFQPGLAYWIAGRPGMGKSTLFCQVAMGLALAGVPVLFFSLEMNREAVLRRMTCQRARVSYTESLQGRLSDADWSKFEAASLALQDALQGLLMIEAKAGRSIREMQAIARQVERQVGGLGVVMVDTLNRAVTLERGEKLYGAMTQASHAVADWAHESDYAVLVAAQLSRANEHAADKRPTLASLRDSGSQEEDADVVIGLHRPGYYDRDDPQLAHLSELLPLKVREGATDTMAELYWEPSWPGFDLLTRRDHADLERVVYGQSNGHGG